ncbi:MAG: ABC transporter permease [Chloroflexales bacterium]|nr:ABC transporter permease [Chloroflexales bacterium]
MTKYIFRRLLGMPPLILGITIVTFLLIHLTPGSPVDNLTLNPEIKPEDLESIKKTLGIGRPLHEQYWSWITQMLQGDMGISLKTYQPVREQIFERLPNTLLLTTSALVLALAVALPIGILAALNRNSFIDNLIRVFATLGISIPVFWLGLMLIIIFAVTFKEWGLPSLPSGGTRTLPNGGDLPDRIRHLILPVITLSLAQLAGWTRYIRSQMLEVIRQDYVRTAQAKGLQERVVMTTHALRNAILPLITLIGLTLPNLFGGSVIVEAIFSWPGIGSLALDAAGNRDYTVVMGTVFFISVVTVLSNLLADICYGIADPRVQYS